MADFRITPTDHTDQAALLLDAAAALLCQLGNAVELDLGTQEQHAAVVYQVQQFLQQACCELHQDEHAHSLPIWQDIRHTLNRISASLEMFRLGLAVLCDLSADRITHVAFHGLMLAIEQARDTINAAVAGEV